MFYKLEEKTPVTCKTGPEWQDWIDNAGERRIVAQDDVGDCFVSTVFQGVDPVVPDSPTPLLFETVIYDGEGRVVGNQGLYPTWEMAEAGHRRAVLWLRNTARANDQRVRKGFSWHKVSGKWVGLEAHKNRLFYARIYPETYKGDQFFTLRFEGQPPRGFDPGDDEHLASPEAAKAYADQRLAGSHER